MKEDLKGGAPLLLTKPLLRSRKSRHYVYYYFSALNHIIQFIFKPKSCIIFCEFLNQWFEFGFLFRILSTLLYERKYTPALAYRKK